jgi:hypothetical protein
LEGFKGNLFLKKGLPFWGELFPKSSPPITKLASRFRGNDKFLFLSFLRKQESTFFSFRQKRKEGKRKGTQRLRRSGLCNALGAVLTSHML